MINTARGVALRALLKVVEQERLVPFHLWKIVPLVRRVERDGAVDARTRPVHQRIREAARRGDACWVDDGQRRRGTPVAAAVDAPHVDDGTPVAGTVAELGADLLLLD
eukprot:scaffold29331_cov112-Isochrysis_galbana.AAC.1